MLRGILRRCSVHISTPHSSEFARLASGTFYCAISLLTFYRTIILDGFVKSPSAVLRGILRRCSVHIGTPHSSEFARLASGAFYCAVSLMTFYEFIILDELVKSPQAPILVIPVKRESSVFNWLRLAWIPPARE